MTTYKYITVEPRAASEEEDTAEYRAGVIHELALALAAPTLAIRIGELLDEIREIRSNNIDSHSSGHQFD